MKREKKSTNKKDSVQESNKSAETVNTPPDETDGGQSGGLGRRAFLGRAAAVSLLAGGLLAMPKLLGKSGIALAQTTDDNCPSGCELDPLTGTARADAAKQRRVNAANYERNMIIPTHPCNGDEQLYAAQNYFASYTKGLKRAPGDAGETYGEVDPTVYCTLLRAIKSGVPADFEQVLLGFSNSCGEVFLSDEAGRLGLSRPFPPNKQRRLESPQAGYNFDLEGKDYYQLVNRPGTSLPPVAFPPAYTFSSAEEVVEIIENYWQALTRDVAFIDYGSNPLVDSAASDLSQFAQYYKGPLDPTGSVNNQITPRVYSRGILRGDTVGPFVSQFLLRDNIPYGAQTISSRIKSPQSSSPSSRIINDFMFTPGEWLMIQRGQTPNKQITIDGLRYIRSGRDLTSYVQNDAIYQAYLNTALLLMTPPDPNDPPNSGGLGVPLNPNNPYRTDTTNPNRYCKQLNFVEFGPSQLLSLLGEVSVRAHKAVWYQKWQVHRRLRPEEFGGRVHFNLTGTGRPRYPINSIINQSNVFFPLATRFNGNYFLPQAFPEGSPVHPAYASGHATLAGAAVTILKAWFDSEQPYANYAPFVEANAAGDALVNAGTGIPNTVADELNKLASNISIARNIAGVHWRSDYTEAVFLGEQVAIQLLADYGFTYNEDFLGFRFRDFSGNLITVGEKRAV